jgi:hypothetical protein
MEGSFIMGLPFIDNTYEEQHKKLKKMMRLFEKLKIYNDGCIAELIDDTESKLIRVAQGFAMYVRDLPEHSANMESKQFIEKIYEEVFDIKVEITPEGWVKVVLPALLPKRSLPQSTWFLREPLIAALGKYFDAYVHEHKSVFRIEHGVMIFKHRYDKNRPAKRYRDLDNIETNAITDSIAFHTLPDDGPLNCFHFYMMEPADYDYTEVYVVQWEDFIKWLKINQNVELKP